MMVFSIIIYIKVFLISPLMIIFECLIRYFFIFISLSYPYIVAIGASSGGLEEINSFFDYTIELNVSYVIIHHFSKENTSTLVELLARHSRILVKYATDQMQVEANVVYILPNNSLVTIENYRFHIKPPLTAEFSKFSIDHFFSSLAYCCKRKTIGIILSGTGTDGVAGLKMIKNE
ncbi:MAG: hypothetical protein EOP47_29330, partial [Sphingobacteriaceae bacterium]